MRAIVIGDLHFKPELFSPLEEFSEFLTELGERTKSNVAVFLGDIFDSPSNISFKVLEEVTNFFGKVVQVFEKVYILVGNHDLDRFTNAHHLKFLDLCEKIRVIDQPFEEKKLYGFFPYNFDLSRAKDSFRALQKNCKVIFAHQDFKGFMTNEFHESTYGISLDVEQSTPLLVLGHYHTPQVKKSRNALVLGSPVEIRSDEAEQQKFLGLIQDERFTVQKIPKSISQRFVLVDSTESIDAVDEKMILVVEEEVARQPQFREKVAKKSLDVRIRQRAQAAEEKIEPSNLLSFESEGVERIFSQFLERQDDLIKSLGAALLEEV